MFTDKITIGIPVYERFDFFEEALNSALNQTIQCSIIVIDNASSHNQFEKIVQQKNTPSLTYIRNLSNIGMIGNWNRCIELCPTEYLTILHDDDTLHPNFIEHCLTVLENIGTHPCCVAVSVILGNDSSFLLKQQQPIVYKLNRFKTKHFLVTNLSPFPGVVFPIKIAKQLNGFDIDKYPIADYDFWIKLSECIDIYKTNFLGAFYRQSAQQGSANEFYAIIDKAYYRQLQLYSQLGRIIYFFPYLYLLLGTYYSYIAYSTVYKRDILKSLENLQTPFLRKCFFLFYKTDKGIVKYFYRFSYRLFLFLYIRT
jgi:glycosyltransferase involved in cell wall biosynthesis